MSKFPLVRTVYDSSSSMPEYFLSVTYRDLGKRKERWAREKNQERVRPSIKEWNIPEIDNPYAGLIAKINKEGTIVATAQSDFLHGIMVTDNGILSASHHSIGIHSLDLTKSTELSSLKSFNALHSMRKTKKGFLLTSAGVDAIFELSENGKEVLWQWWAMDHGFMTDAFGINRTLSKDIDHRYVEYDTWLHTAHPNAAAEYDDNTILVTLFMQGTLNTINKTTGEITPIMSDLKRPHSVRVYADKRISFSDTARGEAYYGKIASGKFILENKVSIKTVWLQDSLHFNGHWLLVDGEHSNVHLLNERGDLLISDQFDADWYLYEATPVDNRY